MTQSRPRSSKSMATGCLTRGSEETMVALRPSAICILLNAISGVLFWAYKDFDIETSTIKMQIVNEINR